MNNTEYILNFLNNELSVEDEQEFFRLLYNDIDLRSEYKCTLKLGNSISKNLNRFAPSMELTASIFASNSLKMPASLTVESKTEARSPLAYSRGFIALTSSILTFVSSLLLFTFVDNFQESKNFATLNTASEIMKNNNQSELPNSSIIKQKTVDGGIKIKKHINSHPEIFTPNLFENKTSANKQILSAYLPVYLNNFNVPGETRVILNQNMHKINHDMEFVQMVPQKTNPNTLVNDNILSENNLGLSIELYGLISWNLPTEKIYPERLSKLNNMEIIMFFKTADWISLGLSVRQETFYVEYTGTENNLNYLYQQQPNLTSYSISARIIPFKLNLFNPYFQTSVGINTAGPVIRGSLGIKYPLTVDFNLFTGGEFNYFIFSHSGNGFTSEKTGLFLGLGYNF